MIHKREFSGFGVVRGHGDDEERLVLVQCDDGLTALWCISEQVVPALWKDESTAQSYAWAVDGTVARFYTWD